MKGSQVALISRHRFIVPGEWQLTRLPSDGALHAITVTPEQGATVQIEVVDRWGSPETLLRYLDMHCDAASAVSRSNRSTRRCKADLSLEIARGQMTIHRRIQVALLEEDLVSVVLTWSKPVESSAGLENAATRSFESVLSDQNGQWA